jgi:hypothetical protein
VSEDDQSVNVVYSDHISYVVYSDHIRKNPMADEFLNDSDSTPTPPTPSLLPARDREAVRVLLIGSRRGIEHLILTLRSLNFAEAHEWSDPQPEPHSGKLMSILTKYLWLD